MSFRLNCRLVFIKIINIVPTWGKRGESMSNHNLISEFNKIYYNDENNTWKSTQWLGTPIQKFPTDLWIYQELIYKLKPDLIMKLYPLWRISAISSYDS